MNLCDTWDVQELVIKQREVLNDVERLEILMEGTKKVNEQGKMGNLQYLRSGENGSETLKSEVTILTENKWKNRINPWRA